MPWTFYWFLGTLCLLGFVVWLVFSDDARPGGGGRGR